ncbi:MAG: KpsF/GutQ family sugar-phosphate isomerase [Nitrospinaceae bacterium]|nr:KpsF/GutQ family sugar-phosphate isomerase [Nitrospinaceae bacterium]MBT3435452.1 KpsF/GutQ family sugar-phosphate isomerase [Nitrospinaceae bacterium]MBT3821313.1 KpsF/GutQ family sugar-phosphate isomerase [Nitrospinaceae bacterium]MBT4094054.1 KpsF/GutQ family sugar-phosphate isomerase [Nitrospinaceae bacterium]MBT4431822.1 KpsF/GutQ family sugar-phosphate isomerase [Nitrospinaceae bacterium]
MDHIERGIRTLQIECDALARLPERLGADFVRAVESILDCKGRVVVTGIGKSGLVGQKIAATLSSIGAPSFFLHPSDGVHGDLGMVTGADVILALSYSGETEELLRVMPVFARLNTPVIAITGGKDSTLAKEAMAFLDVSVAQEACPMNLTPTASSTATMAMGDALAMAVLEASGFREEDFAGFHPGGSLGKSLLRVEDLMVTGDDVPTVGIEAPLNNVTSEISAKNLGMTCVVDASGSLAGIITDGDLRRGLGRTNGNLSANAGELMTPMPGTISVNLMAAAALQIMESKSITALVVMEEDDAKIQGIIHLHHLLRAGVV